MAGVLLSGAVAVAAAVLALAGQALGTQPATVPVSAFGGSAPVHIAHVGHIDVDREKGSAGLGRVACAGASNRTIVSNRTTVCFVARS
jgi:hypothetical protein